MTRRKRPPIESFGPHLLEILRQGSLKRVVVECTNKRPAYYRMRIHHLRQRMREENHELADLVSKVIISIDGDKLIARPADSDDLEAFTAAGLAPTTEKFDEDYYDQFEED